MIGTADSKKKRVQQQERYGASSGNKSAGGPKKKSNDDIDVLIHSEVNSPTKHTNIFEPKILAKNSDLNMDTTDANNITGLHHQ